MQYLFSILLRRIEMEQKADKEDEGGEIKE